MAGIAASSKQQAMFFKNRSIITVVLVKYVFSTGGKIENQQC